MADKDEYRELDKQKKEIAKQLVKKEERMQPEASLGQIGHFNEEWFIKLTKIKGIGTERAKDIGRAFLSEEALIGALKDDTVPFRNDIVKKLENHFQINNQLNNKEDKKLWQDMEQTRTK